MQTSITSNYLEKSRFLQIATVLSLCVISVLVLIMYGSSSFLSALLWALMFLCIIGPIWLSPELRQQVFHPYSYFIFTGLFSFVIPGLVVLLLPNVEPTYTDKYPQAALLLGGAFLGYWIGFSSGLGDRIAKSFPLLAFKTTEAELLGINFWITALLLYSFGWLGRILSGAIGYSHLPIDLGELWQYSSTLAYLDVLADLSYVLMLYILLKHYRSHTWAKVSIVVLISLEMAAGALVGSRSAIVVPVLYFLMAYHFAVRYIPWRYLVICYLLALIVLAPFLTIYRSSYYKVIEQESHTGRTGFELVLSALDLTSDDIIAGNYDWQELWTGTLIEREGYTFRGTLRVVTKVPYTYDYQLGNTFIPSLLALPIPRLIWPEKPIFLPSREFAKTFWEIDTDKVYGTSVGIGMPAEAFYNFGWLGLLIFPLLGVGLRVFYERLKMYQQLEATYIVRVFFILVLLSNLTDSFFSYFGEILRLSIIYLLFMMFINRSLPRWIKPVED